MRNILTIARRELRAYFVSPIGYIYLIAFLLFTNLLALYVIRAKSFFEFQVADMREYFHVLAGVSAFLVAAITMRLWSEERKENTFEMLLTFPMKARHLVLGKFFASLAFYLVALAGTLTVPIMMATLSRGGEGLAAARGAFGLLDPGAVMAGYLGAVLVGAFFIAFGLFISGLCRDQIVAFVLSAPTLFFVYILGIDKIKGDLNSALSFLSSALPFLGKDVGAAIGDFVGVFMHYDNLVRGLVAGSDILFFVIWIAIFLLLNGWGIERRGRVGSNLMYSVAVALLIGIGFATNALCAYTSFGRCDLTEDKVFTVSDVSAQILKRLKEPINVRYVVSPRHKMPVLYQSLERDVRDKLDGLRLASGNMIRVQVIQREAAQDLADEEDGKDGKEAKEDKADAIDKRILKKIKPYPVEVSSADEASAQLIYTGLEIAYRDKETEDVIFSMLPEGLSQLEYFLVRYVDKMTREKAPVVVMIAPRDEPPPYMAQLYRQMGREVPPAVDPYRYLPEYLEREGYEVKRIRLSAQERMPDAYDALAVVGPRELSERQQFEIGRALESGKPVFLAVQNFLFSYEVQERGGVAVSRKKENPNVARLLLANGVSVEESVLMDAKPSVLQVPVNTPFGYMGQPFTLAMQSELKGDSIFTDHPACQGVERFRYFWGTPLRFDEALLKKMNLKKTVLMVSNPGSWKRTLASDQVRNEDIKIPRDLAKERIPLAAMLEGQFKNPFDKAPEWPKEPANPMEPPQPPEERQGEVKPAPGKLIVIGVAQSFAERFIRYPELNFFINCVSSLGLDQTGQDIRKLRDRQYRMRAFSQPEGIGFWKAVHVAGLYTVIAAFGVVVWIVRKRRRDAYTLQFRRTA